ncbi:MAG: 16S rRNA (adenine(1518)-N(6)/adenine(1519)-N(6))-dimethyltransferase RsmA [Bdellovibrionota bacterium]
MSNIKTILDQLGMHPKKSFGQNFLHHPESAKKILRWANVQHQPSILEIGPGLGALTEVLQHHCDALICIEKDKKLKEYLQSQFQSVPGFTLVMDDAIHVNYSALLHGKKTFVFSNLPYRVSTLILERLLSNLDLISGMVFLLQEELVERICAKPKTKNFGRLSIWIQSLCETSIGPRISKGSFYPQPEVESRLIKMIPMETPQIEPHMQKDFFSWIAKIFQQRRKTLSHQLKKMGHDATACEQALRKISSQPSVRAEELDIPQLFMLYQELHHHARNPLA